MLSLFPIEPVYPEGFTYQPDFIDPEEEMNLIKHITAIELHTFNFQGYTAKRKVASFGYDWNFEKRLLSQGNDIPEFFRPLVGRVAAFLQLREEDIQELLVTEYPAGAVINWHRDAPPFEIIAGLSLLADCTFRFRPYEAANRGKRSIISLKVARRSLYVMLGPARTDYQHSILPVDDLRYSITFRTLMASH